MTPEEMARRVDGARGQNHKPGRLRRTVIRIDPKLEEKVDALRAKLPEKASRAAVYRALMVLALEVAERGGAW